MPYADGVAPSVYGSSSATRGNRPCNQYVDQPSQRPSAGQRQLVRRRKPERRSHRHAVRVTTGWNRREPFHRHDRDRRTALPGMVLDDHAQGDALAEHQRAGQAAPRRPFGLILCGRGAGHGGVVKQRVAHHQKPGLGILGHPDRAVQPGGIALLLARRVPMLWIIPGTLEALIPGRMQGHGGTEEVSR